jgi:hypothetical protein
LRTAFCHFQSNGLPSSRGVTAILLLSCKGGWRFCETPPLSFSKDTTVSIVRVGLSNQKYATGYDAIFGGKKKTTAKKAPTKAKKTGKKKK